MVDYWLSINTNEKNFSHFIAEKKNLLHNNIVQQHFQHKINILLEGTQPSWMITEIPGGYWAKVPLVGRCGYFLELHNLQATLS